MFEGSHHDSRPHTPTRNCARDWKSSSLPRLLAREWAGEEATSYRSSIPAVKEDTDG